MVVTPGKNGARGATRPTLQLVRSTGAGVRTPLRGNGSFKPARLEDFDLFPGFAHHAHGDVALFFHEL